MMIGDWVSECRCAPWRILGNEVHTQMKAEERDRDITPPSRKARPAPKKAAYGREGGHPGVRDGKVEQVQEYELQDGGRTDRGGDQDGAG